MQKAIYGDISAHKGDYRGSILIVFYNVQMRVSAAAAVVMVMVMVAMVVVMVVVTMLVIMVMVAVLVVMVVVMVMVAVLVTVVAVLVAVRLVLFLGVGYNALVREQIIYLRKAGSARTLASHCFKCVVKISVKLIGGHH